MEELTGSSPDQTSCALRVEGGTAVLSLAGEIDLTSVETVRSFVVKAMGGGPDRLVFEMSRVEFLDSSGLALLIEAAHGPAPVELRAPSDAVRRLIELTGLSTILSVPE